MVVYPKINMCAPNRTTALIQFTFDVILNASCKFCNCVILFALHLLCNNLKALLILIHNIDSLCLYFLFVFLWHIFVFNRQLFWKIVTVLFLCYGFALESNLGQR